MPINSRAVLRSTLATLLGFALVACRGEQPAGGTGEAGGTVVIASPGEADILFPPLVASLQSVQITSQLFDRLAEIDDSLNTVGDAHFRPRLADSWTWSADSLSIAFHLDPRARWHDGQPVRASDVKFSFDVYHDPATGSPTTPLLANVDSVTVRDSVTAVAWFHARHPEQFYELAYNMYVLPSHLLGSVPHAALRTASFARKPVGTGRFRFVQWVPGERVEIIADTANWRGRPKLDRVIWTFVSDPGAATVKLLGGDADVWESLRGDGLTRAAATPTIRVLRYPSLGAGFVAFNVTRAPFSDRGLRRALGAALDRAALVHNVLDTLAFVATGPLPTALVPAALRAPETPYDAAAAPRALDSLGWRVGPDGIRTKGGKRLAFTLIVPTSSQARQRLGVLMQEQLKRVGVEMTVDPLEPNVFNEKLMSHAYDAAIHVWQTDPTPSTLRQTWATPASGDAANFTGYSNHAVDALLDSAARSFDHDRAAQLYARASAVLTDDAPAIWLYEMKNFAGVHRRLHTTGVRADAWWAGLADWSIPAGERNARDQIGLRTAR